jgi:O-antigen/teichoic acid export membrane protein
MGNLISLAFLVAYAILKGEQIWRYRPQIGLVRKLSYPALIHHSLNIALQVPGLALPVIVTIVVSSQMNAYFYAAWMIASFVFIGPIALATVLYAVGSMDTVMLAQKFRRTLKLSLLIGILACGFLAIAADRVLWVFGADYARQAAWCLRILSLAVFPIAMKNLYVAIFRIRNRIIVATRMVVIGSFLELILATAGGKLGGVAGLSLGWVIAVFIEGVFMSSTVFRFIRSEGISDGQLPGEVSVPS